MFLVLYLFVYILSFVALSNASEHHVSPDKPSFVGVLGGKALIYINSTQVSDIRFSYWWIDQHLSVSRTAVGDFQAVNGYYLIDVDRIDPVSQLCIRFHGFQKEICRGNSWNVTAPQNVRITSSNMNHVVHWDYQPDNDFPERVFDVELYDEAFAREWVAVPECHMIRNVRCSIFNSIHDVTNANECPDYSNGGQFNVRVRACLTTSICSEWSSPERLLILPEDDIIESPDFELLGVFAETQLRLLNKPAIVEATNKSLACYYYNNLQYRIKYWGANDSAQPVRENVAKFDRTTISLKLFEEPQPNTLMCVSMCIENYPFVSSKWRTKCKVANISKPEGSPAPSTVYEDTRFKVILSCTLTIVFIIFIVLIIKTKRFYQSISKYDEELPKELLDVILDMEQFESLSGSNRSARGSLRSFTKFESIYSDCAANISPDRLENLNDDSSVFEQVIAFDTRSETPIHRSEIDLSYTRCTSCTSLHGRTEGAITPTFDSSDLSTTDAASSDHKAGDPIWSVKATGRTAEDNVTGWHEPILHFAKSTISKVNPTYYTNENMGQPKIEYYPSFNISEPWIENKSNKFPNSFGQQKEDLQSCNKLSHSKNGSYTNNTLIQNSGVTYEGSSDEICTVTDIINYPPRFYDTTIQRRNLNQLAEEREGSAACAVPTVQLGAQVFTKTRKTETAGNSYLGRRVCACTPPRSRRFSESLNQRRRLDSFRSVDSGFPTSDESLTPPLSPTDHFCSLGKPNPQRRFTLPHVLTQNKVCSNCNYVVNSQNVISVNAGTVQAELFSRDPGLADTEDLDSSYLKLSALNKLMGGFTE